MKITRQDGPARLRRTHRDGFVALMSAVLLSAILLIIVSAGGLLGWNSRFNAFDAEAKLRSAALADACADTVLLRLSYDAGYGGDETIPLGTDSCKVLPATNPYGTPRVFPIQAVFDRAYTNINVTVNIDTLAITSWQEVPSL